MSSTCTIVGLGAHLPRTIITNADMERMVDTSDEWIRTRTGINTRHFSQDNEPCSVLAHQAALKALEHAGLSAQDLTHIFVGTFSGDYNLPTTACILQDMLGLKGLPAFDLAAACSGFLYCLETARAYIALHPEACILVVGSEVTTSRLNLEDRTTCVLFGDGAGAAIVTGQPRLGGIRIVDVMLKADGSVGNLLTVHGGGSACKPVLGAPIGPEYFVQMNGRDVFKHAVRFMSDISISLLQRNNLVPHDIDLFIPHQANIRIIEAIAKKLGVNMDQVYVNVDRIGNTSAASIPIALTEAVQSGRIESGMKVLLTAFGGGFTWASALLQF
ncbi:MAG: ketoacyl-ACP synthase III [Desulfovibrionales bacterium]|jgi:3-oxoacyl-[acyl-carrier-protein] synthase-3|nr:ketoacyl-ACP synthase III [Desulfovibrionales bacterium]